MLQTGEENIIFLDLDQNADHSKNLIDFSSPKNFMNFLNNLINNLQTDKQATEPPVVIRKTFPPWWK